MRWMILWEIAPERMEEFIRIELKDLSPIPEGVTWLPNMEFLTPTGLMVTFVEADRPEPLFIWAHSFLRIFKSVRVEPALTFEEWFKLVPAIEARAKPQIEEANRDKGQ